MWKSKTAADTKKIAETILAEQVQGEKGREQLKSGAIVLALHGNLGAGKTAFTKCIAELLGIGEVITSPTFVIQKRYEVGGGSTAAVSAGEVRTLIHIDAYRLQSGAELARLQWEELLSTPGTLVCLEWPELVADVVPADAIHLHFNLEGEERTIGLSPRI